MPFGSSLTIFHANVDNQGQDGIIDFIDVSGNLGDPVGLTADGPAIITGIGGDVRFMQVGGGIVQDRVFSSGTTGIPNGSILSSPGLPIVLTDDTGEIFTMTPTPQT